MFLTVFTLFSATLMGCGGGGGGGGGGVGGFTYPSTSTLPVPPPVDITTGSGTTTNNNSSKSSYAILIGVADYPGTANDLNYTAKDATDIYTRINLSPVWNSGTFKNLIDAAATKSAIENAFLEAKNTLNSDGTFFFYYSGHGTNSGDTGYIIPYDALTEYNTINMSNLISSDDLTAYLNTLPSTVKKYVVFDTCHSGYFIGAKSLESNTNKAKFVPMDSSDLNYNDEEFSRSIVGTLNCYVMTSSRGSELSWESGDLQNGVFTYYFCEGLGLVPTNMPADSNRNNAITAEELTNYAPSRVSTYITTNIKGYTQTPQSYDNYSGELRVK